MKERARVALTLVPPPVIVAPYEGRNPATYVQFVPPVVKERQIYPEPPEAIKLLAQIRRAPSSDQLDVLKWIIQKFREQAKKMFEE